MVENLKRKTVRGIFWSLLETSGQQGIQFIISIILARLLLPEEFGLVAMLAIFTAVSRTLVDSGFSQALIQKQNVTYVDECSVFYFNIFLGIVMTSALYFVAPWIAIFYETPILVPLTRLMSLTIVIGAFGTIQTTLLTKSINFKTQLRISLFATALSGAIGISMAILGLGVWSIVAQLLSNELLRTVLLWLLHRWRPAMTLSFTSLGSLFSFGSKLLFSSLLDTIFNNLYLLVIGKTFSAVDLGFYARAKALQEVPVNSISRPIGRVMFPIFSSVQDEKIRLKRGVRKVLMVLAFINFPMMIGVAVVAKPLVLVLLTNKWLPIVPYLQLLCIVGMLYPLHAINLNVLRAQGRSDLFLRLEIIKKIMVLIGIMITYRWGILAMIYGAIVTSLLGYYINTYFTGKLLDYPMLEQIHDLAPSLVLASLMGVSVFSLNDVSFSSPWALLTAQISLGVVLYGTLCRIFKHPSFMDIMELVTTKLGKDTLER